MGSRADVISIIVETVDGVEIYEDRGDTAEKLSDLGVDSLDVASIFLRIQESLGVSVPDDDFDELDTIDKIANYIDTRTAQ